jgi:spectrin beta
LCFASIPFSTQALRRQEAEKRAEEEQKKREKEERERLEREHLARKQEEKLMRDEEKPEQQVGQQPIPEMDGVLQRKNELDEGGRKAVMRSWKQYYTVLAGPLLNFYREKKDFQQNLPAAPVINITHGVCEIARDYQKKKNALRLKLPNGAEYLFIARDEPDLVGWVEAINRAIHTQQTANPLSFSVHRAPASLNPLSSGPVVSTGKDSPPDMPPPLPPPPPPPSSIPPPLDEDKPLSPQSDLLAMQPHSDSTELPTGTSHQELSGDDKRRKKGRFKMFGASRKT